MTNITRDTPTGTAQFVAPSAGGGQGTGLQLSTQNDLTSSAQEPLPGLDGGFLKQRSRQVAGYRVTLTDLRGGMNRLRDVVEEGHSRVKDGHTLETHYRRTATLAPVSLQQTGTVPSGTVLRLSSYSQLGRLFMAIGSRPNHWLTGEGLNGDPTLTDVATFTPGGDVLCMEPIFIGSSPTTERVFLGLYGARPLILSGTLTAPTISATMDASLSDCYGMIATELNDYLMLFLTATGMKTLARSSADGAVASPVLTNIPNPNKAIGLIRAAGGIVRAYWIWNNQVMHTDAEGGTPERLDLRLGPIVDAVKHRDGLAATDGSRIMYYSGRLFEDTKWHESRTAPPDPLYKLICMNLLSNGRELLASCLWYDASGTLSTIMWTESYDPELKRWYQRGAALNAGTTSVISRGMAKSDDPQLIVGGSGYVHTRPSWALTHSRFFPSSLIDPTTYGRVNRESTGVAATPALLFPEPIRFQPKAVDRIFYGGTMPAGARVKVEVEDEDGSGTVSWTFKAPLNAKDRWYEFSKNQTMIMNPVIRVTATRGDNAWETPNCLPVSVEFSAHLGGATKRTWLGWQ